MSKLNKEGRDNALIFVYYLPIIAPLNLIKKKSQVCECV